jgi:aminomethyltransferase
VTDRHRDLAVLAVQGPRSPELVGDLLGPVTGGRRRDLDYMAFAAVR